MTEEGRPTLGVIVPVYNEEGGLRRFHEELSLALESVPRSCTLWFVDDGSRDRTLEVLLEIAAHDSRVRIIELSRNFGHQAALSAGLDLARQDAIVTIDGDGQHPPSLIPKMLALHESGADVVQALRLDSPATSGLWKRLSSRLFYSLVNTFSDIRLAQGSADFRLMSAPAADALRSMPEAHRFIRGMVSWLGFRQEDISYVPAARLSGSTRYSFRKMLDLAAHALFSFSRSPLRLCYILGALLLTLSVGEGLYTAYIYFSPRRSELVPGWSSLLFFVLMGNGMQLFTLGVVAHYVGYIFDEVKGRPRYIVRRLHGTHS
jgi:polyisoprenyl-phosphate glycosyltransferase